MHMDSVMCHSFVATKCNTFILMGGYSLNNNINNAKSVENAANLRSLEFNLYEMFLKSMLSLSILY